MTGGTRGCGPMTRRPYTGNIEESLDARRLRAMKNLEMYRADLHAAKRSGGRTVAALEAACERERLELARIEGEMQTP